MSKPIRLLAIFAFALCLWLTLGVWCEHGSERFYLVLPFAAFALLLAGSAPTLDDVKKNYRPACFFVLVLLAYCTAYVCLLGGFDSLTSGKSSSELYLVFHFFLGMTLMALVVRTGATALTRRLGLSLTLVQLLAPLVTLAVMVPWLMAAIYVHPFKVPNGSEPDQPFENVAFITADGLTLRGWFVPHLAAKGQSSRTVIVCHGFANNRSMFLQFARMAAAWDANVFIFDFRGHGDSDGHTVSMGWRERYDVLAAVHYLRKEKPVEARQIIGFGLSMGTSALILGAAEVEPPLDGLILDSGFASVTELTDGILRGLPNAVRPCLTVPGIPLASLHAGCWLTDVRPEDHIASVRAPILIVHCRDDFLIPETHARRLHDNARAPKKLLLLETGNHCGALFTSAAEYREAVAWLLAQ